MPHTFFELAFCLYLAAFGADVAGLFSAKPLFRWLGLGAVESGRGLHTVGLLLLWVDAGRTELAAEQAATGVQPHGLHWFLTAFGHPPYTNFYESLIFLAWCVAYMSFGAELRWKVRALRPLAIGVVLLLLGRALLASDPAIGLLEPALRSAWIFAHVSLTLFAFACFLVASGAGLALLLRVQTPSAEIGAALAAFAAPLILFAGGARAMLGRFAFQLTPVGVNQLGRLAPVRFLPPGSADSARVLVDVPYAGAILLAALVLFAVAAALYLREAWLRQELGAASPAYALTGLATVFLTVGLGVLFCEAASAAPVPVPSESLKDLRGPYHFAIGGNIDALALLTLTLIASGSFLVLARQPARARFDLPGAETLDTILYRLIQIGFACLSLGLFFGAVWAHGTWGNTWSWEPKETWGFVTWLVYLIYLHTRVALGWSGRRGAFLAVMGFAVVLFCYLGVNLGLTGEGLHGYGAG